MPASASVKAGMGGRGSGRGGGGGAAGGGGGGGRPVSGGGPREGWGGPASASVKAWMGCSASWQVWQSRSAGMGPKAIWSSPQREQNQGGIFHLGHGP